MASVTSPRSAETNTASCQPHTYDRTHPDQIEVSSILKSFNTDPKHLSVISLGKDGVMRNLSSDREVLDAVRFNPRLVKAFLDRVPPDYRNLTPELEEVDGTDISEEQLWHPDPSLLPPPMNEEKKAEALAKLEDKHT